MPTVLEVLGALTLIGVAVYVIVMLVSRAGTTADGVPAGRDLRPVSDRHTHRWSRWEVIDERRIHLYGEVDEGRELPDRIDVVLRRECVRCGLPETQTVRGLDAKRRD